jgi:hypothetical protein
MSSELFKDLHILKIMLYSPSFFKNSLDIIFEFNFQFKNRASLGSIKTSLRSRLSWMPHGRHNKEERQEIWRGNLSLDSRSHQTGDAAFIPATPHDLQNSRANTDLHNSQNTQHTRVKQIHVSLCKMALSPARHVLEDTSHQTRARNRCGWCLFAYGEYKLD